MSTRCCSARNGCRALRRRVSPPVFRRRARSCLLITGQFSMASCLQRAKRPWTVRQRACRLIGSLGKQMSKRRSTPVKTASPLTASQRMDVGLRRVDPHRRRDPCFHHHAPHAICSRHGVLESISSDRGKQESVARVPTHPNRYGGQGSLASIVDAFTPLLLAKGVVVAGMIADCIFWRTAGAHLQP